MPARRTLGSLLGGAAVLALGLAVAGEGRAIARLDPLLSLCLAARPGVTPATLWSSWSLAPQIVLPLLLAALAGLPGRGAGRLRVAAFTSGLLLLALALVSPLCRLAASLAAAHMVQHVLLVAVVPPLLVAGLPAAARRLASGPLARPGPAAALYGLAIWLSHLPAVYQAALLEPAVHLLLLAGQLAAGLLFWQVLLDAASHAGARSGGALLMAFATFMHTGLLGALLTFAGTPWYPLYGMRPLAFGLTPLADQQLAGVIMWVPMCGIYLAAGLAAMARLLAEPRPRPG